MILLYEVLFKFLEEGVFVVFWRCLDTLESSEKFPFLSEDISNRSLAPASNFYLEKGYGIQ